MTGGRPPRKQFGARAARKSAPAAGDFLHPAFLKMTPYRAFYADDVKNDINDLAIDPSDGRHVPFHLPEVWHKHTENQYKESCDFIIRATDPDRPLNASDDDEDLDMFRHPPVVFHVHRTLLTRHSDLFKELFANVTDSENARSSTDGVHLALSIAPDLFNALLDFMYNPRRTVKTIYNGDISDEHLGILLREADAYQMEYPVILLERYMIGRLSGLDMQMVQEWLVLAVTIHNDDLADAARKVIVGAPITSIDEALLRTLPSSELNKLLAERPNLFGDAPPMKKRRTTSATAVNAAADGESVTDDA